MKVVGAGVGRTGTYSLKLAINQLGLGPCHHMDEVLHNRSVQVPLWTAAARGRPEWTEIFKGYESAVDWPVARFFREMSVAYPEAKFVLTVRSPESWAESFSQTIYRLLADRSKVPPEMHAWFDMAVAVVSGSGFPANLDTPALMDAFNAHNAAVKAEIPADRLLVFQVKDGWQPLCDFLGVPAPSEPFPRTNDRVEFWDRVSGKG